MIQKLLPKPVYVKTDDHTDCIDPRIIQVNNLTDILSEEAARFSSYIEKEQFKAEGYILRTSDKGILVYAESPAGRYHGTNTANRLVKAHGGIMDSSLIIDYPEFAIRGVLEGFYGIPWTWQARKDIVEICSRHGFNHYVFAPCDISLKINWRDPLNADFEEKLEELIDFAHQHHMKFVYELLPIAIDLNSESEYRTLLERCREAVALGADAIIFAFDDTNDYCGIRVKTRQAAERQVRAANRLREDLDEDILLCFTPVKYYGIKDSKYLKVIRTELAKEIMVGWTGPRVRSSTVTVEDAKAYGELIGRKPFLGHNFPVIDEMSKKRRITTSPLIGLDSDLSDVLSGIGFNFMELPYASLIAGLTCADYAWNPEKYDPEQSIRNSCNILGPNLIKLVELNPESEANLNGVHPLALALRKRLKKMDEREKSQLQDAFNTMTNLDSIAAEGTHPQIYQELRPWLNQGNITGALGNQILNGGIERLGWKERGFGTSKMTSGYRLGGLVFEDWILREFGFPANLYRCNGLRLIGDFFETVYRKRHKKQKL